MYVKFLAIFLLIFGLSLLYLRKAIFFKPQLNSFGTSYHLDSKLQHCKSIMQQLSSPLLIDAAKHGPAAGVTPVLMPVQEGSLDSR